MPDEHEEERALKFEFEWLLQDETPYVLAQLKEILKACLQKFTGNSSGGSVYRAENYLLSLPNSDAVRGVIGISGDSVIKADLQFKIPKLSHGRCEAVSPWKLKQLQDANNHLNIALEEVYEREECGQFHSGQEICQLMSSLMASLNKGKSCLLVPGKKSLNELMTNGQQKVLIPPLPEEVLVNFHINCDKLVFSVYVLNNLTAAPSHTKNLPPDPSHIGHVFEYNSKWYEVVNRIEIVSTVPWLKEIIVLFNNAQQLCQQLKDKINMFHNLLPSLDLNQLDIT